VAIGAALKVPGAQAAHVPVLPDWPTGQLMHDMPSGAGPVPAGHAMHPMPAMLVWPAGHALHIALPAGLVVPAGQFMHAALPAVLIVLAAQGAQAVVLPPLAVPAAQGVHTGASPVVLIVPGAQAVQPRSLVAVGCMVTDVPARHDVHGVHALALVVLL